MHPDAAAFEACIKQHPHDSTPRLVYADWVQESGDDEFAAALRRPEFYGIVGWCVRSGWGLRTAWEAERYVRGVLAGVRIRFTEDTAAGNLPGAFAAWRLRQAAVSGRCPPIAPSADRRRAPGAAAC